MSKDVSAEKLSTAVCGRCDGARDLEDNFCRYCGFTLVEEPPLPSYQSTRPLPAIRTPSVSATVARGAAFVAAGKIAEIVIRRVARNALRNIGRSGKAQSSKNGKAELVANTPEVLHTTEVVSETVLLRQTRIRR